MAHLKKPAKKDDNDRRVNDILSFARTLLELVRDRKPIVEDVQANIEGIIKRIAGLSPSPSIAARASELESTGTELWNGTTHLLRDAEEHEPDPQVRRDAPTRTTVLLRVFAFHLLDAAYRASGKRTKDAEQRVRNFKLALKTCRYCLDNDELELTQRILERCSDHASVVDNASPLVRLAADGEETGGTARMKELAVEFCLLRTMHGWKSGRLDLATHFTSKLDMQSAQATNLPEKAADLFYEIGKSLLRQPDIIAAPEWLERALAMLDTCDVEHLTDYAADLRLSISAKLVRCLTLGPSPDGRDRAKQIVQRLVEDPIVGNRLAVQVMQLDLLQAETPAQAERIEAVLDRIVHNSVMTDQTFRIVLQAIHRTKKCSIQIACDALLSLIGDRLIPLFHDAESTNEQDRDRIEKACVTFVLFAVKDSGNLASPPASMLQSLLDTISSRAADILSAKAVHAMQMLIWKSSSSSHPATTEGWLQLLRHPAFDGAGLINKARIGRKAIMMAIERDDADAAREAYFRMPPAAQSESLTQYLVFKLALRCDDYEQACKCLDTIARQTRSDSSFLYACVLEAQQSKMRHIAIAAFGALLDKQPPGVHLPTLLRCAARLLAAELDSCTRDATNDVVVELVQIFERAVANVKTLRRDTGDQWRAEVQWWSKNAYNLSLKICGNAHPELLCRLLATCATFVDNYPSDGGVMHGDDLKRRKLLCHFLAASAFVVLARSGSEGEEYSLQCYMSCRQQVREFWKLFDALQEDEDLSRRLFVVLKYDVESILHLQQWDQLNAALQSCLDCKHIDRWDTLADLVLIIHSQSSTTGFFSGSGDNNQLIQLIQRIINETWKRNKDLTKVSRWLRLSFSVDLSDGDGAFAFKLLQQAADMAKKGYDGNSEQTYPETELQWLAATAFNRAVDFLSEGEYDMVQAWMEAALEVARYAADEGALHANLSYKRDLAMERIEKAGAA